MKEEMGQRGCPFLGTNGEKWPKIENFAIFDHFSPFEPAHFFNICAYSWATPLPHLCLYWQKSYHWMLLQWYLRRESYFRLLPPHFPAISLKIPFFGPFWPLFIICACLLAISLLHLCLYWKKVFTGCCCNDICKEKATSGYLHPIFLPFARKFHFFLFLAILHHLCLLEGNPFIPLPLLLTKLLSLGAVAMISAKR